MQVSYRGAFAYVTGVLPGGEQIPLFRLRYGGSAHSFGLAIYSAARGGYQDTVLSTGLPIGTPQEALDTACTIHLAALRHEPDQQPSPSAQPPTNFRGHPLSLLFNLLLSRWFPAPWRLCRRRGGWQVGGFSRRAAFRDLAFRVSVRPRGRAWCGGWPGTPGGHGRE